MIIVAVLENNDSFSEFIEPIPSLPRSRRARLLKRQRQRNGGIIIQSQKRGGVSICYKRVANFDL